MLMRMVNMGNDDRDYENKPQRSFGSTEEDWINSEAFEALFFEPLVVYWMQKELIPWKRK